MHHGEPLTDQDRGPWLRAIAAWIDNTRKAGSHGVVACSALKRAYRDILIGARRDVRLAETSCEKRDYLHLDRLLLVETLTGSGASFFKLVG